MEGGRGVPMLVVIISGGEAGCELEVEWSDKGGQTGTKNRFAFAEN